MAEARVLEHRQPLVVVHRDDAIEIARLRRNEDRVGRQRSGDVQPFGAQRRKDRSDDVDFLAAEVAAFAGVAAVLEGFDSGFLLS